MKLMTQILLAPALALGLTATAMAQEAPSPYDALLTLTPATGTTTSANGSLTYDINISQLQNNPDAPQALAVYDLFIDFNPAIVSVTGATINSGPLGNVGSAGDLPYTATTPNTTGQFELSDLALDDNSTESNQGLGDFSTQPTSFTIGTITFTGVTSGTSALTFDVTSSLSDQNANNITFDPTGSVIATPEPSSFGLGMVAIFGAAALIGLRRRNA